MDVDLGVVPDAIAAAAAVLAGGYAPDVNDTVRIHYGTACSLIEHPVGGA